MSSRGLLLPSPVRNLLMLCLATQRSPPSQYPAGSDDLFGQGLSQPPAMRGGDGQAAQSCPGGGSVILESLTRLTL